MNLNFVFRNSTMKYISIIVFLFAVTPACLARIRIKNEKILSPSLGVSNLKESEHLVAPQSKQSEVLNASLFYNAQPAPAIVLPTQPQLAPIAMLPAQPQPAPIAVLPAQPVTAPIVVMPVQQQPIVQATTTEYFQAAGENVKNFVSAWWTYAVGGLQLVPKGVQPVPVTSHATSPAPYSPLGGSVASLNSCFSYSPGYVNIGDWDNAANLGWTARNELGIPRISLLAPVVPPQQGQLVLKNLRCNGAEYSARIRLDSESCGGLIFRAQSSTDRNSMVVELNTLTKSIALKQITNGVPKIIDEHTDEMIQPQILQKVVIRDHGNDGLIEVELNDKTIIRQAEAPYFGAGSFGPWICQGSAVFSDLSSKEK